MPVNILMPALSPTMEKGNLAKWLKKEGDKVKPGDVIAEIETDKATMEYEAIDEGTLAKIVVPEGTQDVPVNQLIAVLAGGGRGREGGGRGGGEGRGACKAASPATASPGPLPKGRGRTESLPQSARVCRRKHSAPTAPPAPAPLAGEGGGEGARTNGHGANRVFSSPLARRLAKEAGIDLARIPGLRPAWPRDRARRRGGEIRQGSRRTAPRLPPRPASRRRRCRRPPTTRSARCSSRAATRSSRTTISAR